MGCCDCAVDAGVAWGVPGEGRDKLGLANSDNWYPGSCCGEGSGVFNTACKSPERALLAGVICLFFVVVVFLTMLLPS